MDTQTAFGLGVLAVIGMGMLIAVTVGMLRLSHLEGELEDLQRSVNTYLTNSERHLEKLQDDLHKRIDKESGWVRNDLHHEIQNLHRRIDETHSVMDSRFDKFENKIKETIVNKKPGTTPVVKSETSSYI